MCFLGRLAGQAPVWRSERLHQTAGLSWWTRYPGYQSFSCLYINVILSDKIKWFNFKLHDFDFFCWHDQTTSAYLETGAQNALWCHGPAFFFWRLDWTHPCRVMSLALEICTLRFCACFQTCQQLYFRSIMKRLDPTQKSHLAKMREGNNQHTWYHTM